MIEEIRNLAGRLKKGSARGGGAKLKPAEVEIALLALRAMTAPAGDAAHRAESVFEIELLDAQSWPLQILAASKIEGVARAAFKTAASVRPGQKIRLRRGRAIIATTD
jgi:hypothetical protein